MKIIGIDAASRQTDIGLAIGTAERVNGRWRADISAIRTPGPTEDFYRILRRWFDDSVGPFLVAVDAPLGWPATFQNALEGHRAGQALGDIDEPERPRSMTGDDDNIKAHSNALFRRHTDLFIEDKLGKRPLEIGADRIARASSAMLYRLNVEDFGLQMVWTPEVFTSPERDPSLRGMIEVYPAATLQTLDSDLTSPSYKRSSESAKRQRQKIVAHLTSLDSLTVPDSLHQVLAADDDCLDALLCVLAALDFLNDEAMKPEDGPDDRIKREGWIWCRSGGDHRR